MIRSVGVEQFYHDGRGPELRRTHGEPPQYCLLRAIEYFCPDDASLRHVRFVRPQALMFTPEEVIGRATGRDLDFRPYGRAAALDHGRSEWLLSFAPLHLERCHHFQLLFYDELLDIICEELDFRSGPHSNADHAA